MTGIRKWISLNLKLTPKMITQVDSRAEEIGIGRSAMIRLIIHEYFERSESK